MTQSQKNLAEIKALYEEYPEMPYISPKRNIAKWLKDLTIASEHKVPLRNMQRTEEDLLPGDIILLWRISHGTFTNESVIPKYFEYDYGINAPERLVQLIEEGYAESLSSLNSLDYVTAALLKNLLKLKKVTGYSSLKKAELMQAIKANYSDDELAEYFTVRGIRLTDKGNKALNNNQTVVDKHPKKM